MMSSISTARRLASRLSCSMQDDALQQDEACHHFGDVPDDGLNLCAERGAKGERRVATGEQVDEIGRRAKVRKWRWPSSS
jgi:hypothetical protein